MKSIHLTALAICCLAASLEAKPKEFTILGGQKITAEVDRGMPLPATKDGVTIQVAAFMVEEENLVFTFGFDSSVKLEKVVVEDVSGTSAVVLVNDPSPTPKSGYWKGDAAPLPLNKTSIPWIWEKGDTTKVFRFTVSVVGRAEPIEIFQPAIYSGRTKKQLQQFAKK